MIYVYVSSSAQEARRYVQELKEELKEYTGQDLNFRDSLEKTVEQVKQPTRKFKDFRSLLSLFELLVPNRFDILSYYYAGLSKIYLPMLAYFINRISGNNKLAYFLKRISGNNKQITLSDTKSAKRFGLLFYVIFGFVAAVAITNSLQNFSDGLKTSAHINNATSTNSNATTNPFYLFPQITQIHLFSCSNSQQPLMDGSNGLDCVYLIHISVIISFFIVAIPFYHTALFFYQMQIWCSARNVN